MNIYFNHKIGFFGQIFVQNIRDGHITQEEFLDGCLFNPTIARLLQPFV